MKTPLITLLAAAFLLVGTGLFAEEKAKGAHGPEALLEKMKTELKLTDEQITKVKAIYAEAAKKKEALKDSTQDEQKKQGKELMKATMDKVRAVLTPDQAKKWDAYVEEQKKKKAAK